MNRREICHCSNEVTKVKSLLDGRASPVHLAFFMYIYFYYYQICSLYNFIQLRVICIEIGFFLYNFWPCHRRSGNLLLVRQKPFQSAFFVYIFIYYFQMCFMYDFYSIVGIPRRSRCSWFYYEILKYLCSVFLYIN